MRKTEIAEGGRRATGRDSVWLFKAPLGEQERRLFRGNRRGSTGQKDMAVAF